MKNVSELALQSKAWPFVEAKKLIKRTDNINMDKDTIVFETGYGPSGTPHIGTYSEVLRTNMVKNAFEIISNKKTKLITFSDDMDGLRKVPEGVPNQKMLLQHLNKPLSSIPDPYNKFSSFAEHNNYLLQNFLDQFNFKYEFKSATECYKNGDFDKTLLSIIENYDEVMDVILPTLGEERRKSYSPFLPICPNSGIVLEVPIKVIDQKHGVIAYKNENHLYNEIEITKGKCKLQWKVDWAMRWVALGIDYEMNGKDLIPSFHLSKKIASIIDGHAPVNMTYELFLDELPYRRRLVKIWN